jgi:hypothetical protein
MLPMSTRRFLILPVGIAGVGVVYYFLSHEMVGTTMLVIFAIAMTVFGSILLPTVNDVGPTAPVDPDWEPADRRR